MDSEPCQLILDFALVVQQSAPLLCCLVLASFDDVRIGSLTTLRRGCSFNRRLVQLQAQQGPQQVVERTTLAVFDVLAQGEEVD